MNIRENILVIDDAVKLADLGSCRGIFQKQPYTEYISTRWYRAPECLLTDGYYGYKVRVKLEHKNLCCLKHSTHTDGYMGAWMRVF